MRRAQAVSQYLTQQGVALNRIATEAKGKTQLIKNENPYHTNG
ncbi:ompA family protein [Acinetobacter baumannii 83444]|nr:OmpA domain protein [Acinetobacter baumannii Naval-82]EXE76122.1 ompA family protein [Acinetobacter baumannii 83444]KCX96734.1 ompA family protein [Acinetobacter sp. 72431]